MKKKDQEDNPASSGFTGCRICQKPKGLCTCNK